MAPDMRQAIRLVRDALGPEAVILSSRQVEGGMELMATVDFDAELVTGMEQYKKSGRSEISSSDAQPQLETTSSEQTVSGQSVHLHHEDLVINALQHELASMRDLLEGQLARIAWSDFSRERPRQAEVVRRLERMGIDADLARAIVESGSRTNDLKVAWREALAQLAKRLPLGHDEIVQEGGVIALLGPTGVGKTISLAKLAAHYIMRHGRHSVSLVSTDGYRVGGHNQITTLGQLLGVPVYQAEGTEELHRVLTSLKDNRLILIDTPGIAPRNEDLESHLDALTRFPDIRPYVVVAANMSRGALRETLSCFSQVSLCGAILTKLDEADSLGAVFSALIEHGGIRLSYLGTGQRIAEDLEPARLQRLLSHAVGLTKSSGRWPRAYKPSDKGGQHAHAG